MENKSREKGEASPPSDTKGAQEKGDVRLTILVGPGIGGDSYEVGEEVARHFRSVRLKENGKYLLDLRSDAKERLAGLSGELPRKDEIVIKENFHGCTYEENRLFYSHRKGDRERNLNTILIKSERFK
jgi:copper oxidase (laccase) domain-containing protein